MYSLVYTKEARDNIDELPLKKKRQIKDAVERLAADPGTGKSLTHDLKGLYSYRSGDFRIIYRIFREKLTILVITIGNRKDVYEKLSKRALSLRNISLNETVSQYGKKMKKNSQ